MQRPECEKSKAHSRQKKFSGQSQRDLSLKDKHARVNVFVMAAAFWSRVEISVVSTAKGKEAIWGAVQSTRQESMVGHKRVLVVSLQRSKWTLENILGEAGPFEVGS